MNGLSGIEKNVMSFGLLLQKQQKGVETTGSVANKDVETSGSVAMKKYQPLFNFGPTTTPETTGSVASNSAAPATNNGSAGNSLSVAA